MQNDLTLPTHVQCKLTNQDPLMPQVLWLITPWQIDQSTQRIILNEQQLFTRLQ